MLRPWRFRTVLPIAMTTLQLGLSVASLVQKWQLPNNPGEPHKELPPTTTRGEGDRGQTVPFSPDPDWAKTSRTFEVATAVSLPAMFCTAVIVFPLVLLGMHGSDPLWIAISAVLGIVMWRGIGRWVDEQRDVSRGIRASRSRLQNALRRLLRGAVIFLFLLFATVFTPVNHQHAGAAILLACTWLAWSGIYLVLSFWGESRDAKLAHAKAATCTASES